MLQNVSFSSFNQPHDRNLKVLKGPRVPEPKSEGVYFVVSGNQTSVDVSW